MRRKLGSGVHFWPFDGWEWEVPVGRSAVVEVYPILWRHEFPRDGRTGSLSSVWIRMAACAPKGYAWDGADLCPEVKAVMRASLEHDAVYQLIRKRELPRSWRAEADRLFRRLCIEDGMPVVPRERPPSHITQCEQNPRRSPQKYRARLLHQPRHLHRSPQRVFIADPHLPNKGREDRTADIRTCWFAGLPGCAASAGPPRPPSRRASGRTCRWNRIERSLRAEAEKPKAEAAKLPSPYGFARIESAG